MITRSITYSSNLSDLPFYRGKLSKKYRRIHANSQMKVVFYRYNVFQEAVHRHSPTLAKNRLEENRNICQTDLSRLSKAEHRKSI